VLKLNSRPKNEECKGEEMMKRASIFLSIFLHPFKLFDEFDGVERLIVLNIKTGNKQKEK